MKRILFLLNIIFVLPSCHTTKILVNFAEPTNNIYEVQGTKDELFLYANRWMVTIFKDARSIIQYSDKEQGTLIGKYLLHNPPYDYSNVPTVYAIIEINVKDNKAKITITPDNYSYVESPSRNYSSYNGQPYSGTKTPYQGRGHNNDTKVVNNYTKEKAVTDMTNLCEDFNKSLLNSASKPKF